MVQDEWEIEMDRMVDSFAKQASISLEKIGQRFAVLGRSFDKDFRQNFMKMSNLSLRITLNTFLESQHKPAENQTNSSPAARHVKPLKIENLDDGGLIEIDDSDDDDNHLETKPAIDLTIGSVKNNEVQRHSTNDTHNGAIAGRENGHKSSVQVEHNDANEDGTMVENRDSDDDSSMEINTNNGSLGDVQHQNLSDKQNDTPDIDDRNEVKLLVKDEPSAGGESELHDIPMIEFDANTENCRAIVVSGKPQNNKSHPAGPSSKVKSNPSKRNAGNNQFKCKHCDCTFKAKYYLKQHKPVHENGKFIGLKADSNGQYQCTHCIRRFSNMGHLIKHMKSHKDNQYLYDCARCMWQFVRKADKDKHESVCDGHRFECHLCKVYVTVYRSHMQIHMRTHSGVKPFRCMVCGNCFQTKSSLKTHLNTVHARNRP